MEVVAVVVAASGNKSIKIFESIVGAKPLSSFVAGRRQLNPDPELAASVGERVGQG